MEAAIENPVIFKGDVPLSIQKQIVAFSDFHLKDVHFARTTGRDLVLTEAAVYKRPEDRKLQSRVVYQIIVGEGTLRIAYTYSTRRGVLTRSQICSTGSARSTAAAPPSL